MEGTYFYLDIEPDQIQHYTDLGFDVIDNRVNYYATAEEVLLHRELGKLAGKHLGGSLHLELMDFHPIAQPYQRMRQTHQDAILKPTFKESIETIKLYANIAFDNDRTGRFDELVDAFASRRDLMRHKRNDRAKGKNWATVSEHTSLPGIIMLHAADIVAQNDPSALENSAIVASKLITRLSAFGGAPAPDVISSVAASYYSVPPTKTIFHSGISRDTAHDVNAPMLTDLGHRLQKGGQTVAIAASGTIDERHFTDHRLSGITMHRASKGTERLLAKMDFILPAALWLDAPSGQPWFWLGEITDEVKNKPEATHDIMKLIGSELSLLAGVEVDYEAEHLHGMQRVRGVGEKVRSRVLEEFHERRHKRWEERKKKR